MLSAREGYRLWAPTYSAETAVSALEDATVTSFGIATAGTKLLDAACGSGRRLRNVSAKLAVGIDLTPQMLVYERSDDALYAAADLRALPFHDASFDVVWCRLAIGHIRALAEAYRELARVCRAGGHVVVTDFHPAAVAAGHKRTFRDTRGAEHEIEHYVHSFGAHVAAAADAGLSVVDEATGRVGEPIREYYERADRTAAYDAQIGLPLVLALSFVRGM